MKLFGMLRLSPAFALFTITALAQPGGFGPPGGGPGGPGMMRERKIVKQYDKDGDKRLNNTERAAARAAMADEPRRGFGPRPFGPRGGEPRVVTPGPKVTQDQVKKYTNEPLYDMGTLRTVFLEFENADWEKELEAFHNTDVEVPAKLTVDGKAYDGVGVHFRGMSSYMMVPAGLKRSLNLSLDFMDKEQRLGGYRTLNLLNSHMDPTFLRTVLYMQIARQYIPAPKANYMRVVINGESWGIYVNAQQFNTDSTKEWFQSTAGARWKVRGSPMGRGGLRYISDDPEPYKQRYEIKSKDDKKSWAALINLCKVLAETPPEKLEAALEPILDIEGTLKFLALDKALINADGYWTRASDYSIYMNEKGRFHVIPHDANETLRGPEGPGPGGPGRGGMRPPFPPPEGGPPRFGPGGFGRGPRTPSADDLKLDPFAGENDPEKALLNKMLAVPAMRTRYLKYMKEITTTWLDWKKIEPMTRQYQALIAADVKIDTRKLDSTEAFTKAVTEEITSEGGGPFGGAPISLKTFVEKRREYLLAHPEIQKIK